MFVARLALLFAFALAGGLVALAPPASAAQSCTAFMAAFAKAAPELKPQFVRPVVVSRGALEEGAEVRDLVSEVGVDARLYCRGEQFLRFEAQIAWPADARLRDGFSRIQEGALVAGLRWGRSRAASTLNSMAAEAAEFLRASRERGDVFVSGKVERHAGSEGELGLVWTEADRSFILVSARF